ncbi:MAG: TolC family protein [Halofilum sp. (in: g-proteobacteria)]|nr:TolC family protein [Halofilum sp. (in: g-proteobacteria)]
MSKPCEVGRPYGRSRLALTLLALIATGCSVTPDPIERETLQRQGAEDRAALADSQAPIEHPLRPSEAIARALLHNRQRRVRAMEAALKDRELDAAAFEMLPSLTARAGYTERSEFAATQSVPFANGEPQDPGGGVQSFSVSQEKERTTYGVDFTWSVLDFGLSWVRAGQKGDQYLLAREQERKALQTLAQDTRAAYWKAISADRLLDKIGPLMDQVEQALDQSRQIGMQRVSDPMNALAYQRSLLDIKRSLGSLREELIGAEQRLARLMGLPPSTDIPLPQYGDDELQVPELPVDMATMERTAFVQRPEIVSAHYRERISQAEVRAAFLKMFPDLRLNAGYSNDDNRFLRFNDWTTAGAEVSWDLFNVFKADRDRRAAETGVELARERRLAASIAVLTQVHLATLDFEHSKRKMRTASEYLDVSRGISELVRRQQESDSGGRLQVIKERLNALVAELRRDLAYAQIQNTHARIFKSMGLDPYPHHADTPARLARAIETRQTLREQGWFGVVITPIADQDPRLEAADGADGPRFQISADTFSLAGDVEYSASRANGRPLPDWLAFNSATRTFRATAPAQAEPVELRVRARNEHGIRAWDRFVLQPGDAS